MKVSILSGGDAAPHYMLGILSGLVPQKIYIDYIGSNTISDAEIFQNPKINFLNLRGDQNTEVSLLEKIIRISRYYLKLIAYTLKSDSKVFHIQWFNKFILIDRIFLNLFYKSFKKKLVFTAHNINAEERDGKDSLLNKISLTCMYRIMDHIIVHTDKMKSQLIEEFKIRENKISVIPHGIIDVVPKTDLTRDKARDSLNLKKEKIILFFGRITPYKGLEILLKAMTEIVDKENYKLIIAGRVDKNRGKYWDEIIQFIEGRNLNNYIINKIDHIPDEEVEIYFKAADVLILPYTQIFQSGVLFLSYYFGLPVIATDVGSFKEDIIENETGLVCKENDPSDLARKIEGYFKSPLYRNLETSRPKIIKYATEKYSWGKIGEETFKVYKNLSK